MCEILQKRKVAARAAEFELCLQFLSENLLHRHLSIPHDVIDERSETVYFDHRIGGRDSDLICSEAGDPSGGCGFGRDAAQTINPDVGRAATLIP